ncbi:sulfotransferase [Sphingopyxis terrae subsp. ummariensis]
MSPSKKQLDEAGRLVRSGQAAVALPHLQSWASGATSFGAAHALYLEALIALGRRKDAIEVLEAAMASEPEAADAYDALAFFALQLDRHALSNNLYRRATQLQPDDPQFWYNYATSERSLGRLAHALEACERAIAIDPAMRPAILLRSELARATPERNNVEDLRARIARDPHASDTMFLSYALGKELHELGLFDEAFAAFARGATARRRSLRYDVAMDEDKMRRIAAAFGSASRPSPQEPAGRHIFIIGLPRSGTTLTERILGGLPDVRSNNETNNFSSALLRHAPAVGGDVFERAAKADFAAVAREYEELAGGDDHPGAIIEKLPFNYLYVGAILRAFPHTPIVWVRRDPVDSCFAMFRTLFGAAYPFSYDFNELARYYAAYDRLMRHWTALFGERLIRVDYERLVAEPGTVAPWLADRCGLPWRESALDISRNSSASLTASAAQVRGGIYTSSSGISRNYGKHLAPLREKLIANGIALA